MHGTKFCALAVAMLAFASAPLPAAAKDPGALIARTGARNAQGVRHGDLIVFKGLPYAAPSVGALRWREPQAATPWQGTRKADRFGNACIQVPGAATREGAGDAGPLGEDCLTQCLDTKARRRAKAAVMVWIHGGALAVGARRYWSSAMHGRCAPISCVPALMS